MRNPIRFCLALLLFSGPSAVHAQRLVIDKLTPEDGLASNQTYQTLQDRFGFMWFACTGGLSRYDGYSFINYTSTDGLSHSTVLCLAEDFLGQIWIGTQGGLHSIAPSNMKNLFSGPEVTIRSYPGLAPLQKKWISALTIDKEKKMWIGVQNFGLYLLDLNLQQDSAAFAKSLTLISTDEHFNKSYTHSIYDDGMGQIWISTDQGLFCVNKLNFHIQHYTVKHGLLSNDVMSVFLDENLMLLVGTTGGLCYMDLQSRRVLPYRQVRNGFRLNDPVTYITKDRNKNLWVGTRNGVYRKEPDTDRLTAITTSNGLSDNFIRHIFQDREHLMWFTTDAAGVSHLITEKFSNYNQENGLPSNVVRCFAEDSRGHVWIATSNGLSVWDGNAFRTIQLSGQSADNSVWVIYPDRDNRFWIGTQNGIYLCSEQGTILKHLSTAEGLIDRGVRDLAFDNERRLWIATQFGLSVYNPINNRISNYTTANGLPAVYIRSLSVDRFGRMWIGTRGGGLCKVISRDDSSIRVQTHSTHNGFPSNTVGRIFHDAHDRIWVATHGGLVVMDGDSMNSGIRHHLSDKNGLPHNLVSTLTRDRNGYYWVCGDKGTTQVLYRETDSVPFQIIKHYNKKSGMAGEEFTTNNSIFLDRNGSLWFGLFGGITVYHPSRDVVNEVPPYIYITSVSMIGGEDNNSTQTSIGSWLWGDVPLLAHHQNNLNFQYTALTFQDTRQTFYQYFLEGFDADWSALTLKRDVRYTNLQPGEYNFHVRARTPNGLWSQYAADLTFHIAPPFWDTWWFRVLVFGITVLLILAVIRFRTHHIGKTNRELEQKIIERTYELTVKNEQLRDLNKIKDEFLNIAAHDLRNPLNSILCTSRIIVEETMKNEYDTEKYLRHDVNSIIQASQHMLELINNLLDLAKIEAGKIHLNLDRRDINLLIREQLEAIEPVARLKDIGIDFEFDRRPVFARMDKEKIWQALNNLLSNAIKFTDPGGRITIRLNPMPDEISISISDTGRGIPKDKLSMVFDKFSELSRVGTSGERGTGLGMAITKSIIELHGGRIWVDSQVGQGTCFTFTLISNEGVYDKQLS